MLSQAFSSHRDCLIQERLAWRCADAEVKGKDICQNHRTCPLIALNVEVEKTKLNCCRTLLFTSKTTEISTKRENSLPRPKPQISAPSLLLICQENCLYKHILRSFSFVPFISTGHFTYKLHSRVSLPSERRTKVLTSGMVRLDKC